MFFVGHHESSPDLPALSDGGLLSFQNRIRESQVGPRWAGSGTLSRLTTLFKNQRVARVVNGPRLEPTEKALPKKQISIRVRHTAKDISKNYVSNF